jgi:hypothetical protein
MGLNNSFISNANALKVGKSAGSDDFNPFAGGSSGFPTFGSPFGPGIEPVLTSGEGGMGFGGVGFVPADTVVPSMTSDLSDILGTPPPDADIEFTIVGGSFGSLYTSSTTEMPAMVTADGPWGSFIGPTPHDTHEDHISTVVGDLIEEAKCRTQINTPRLGINSKYIDTNLIENSNDSFRNQLKANYSLKKGEFGREYVFSKLLEHPPILIGAGPQSRNSTVIAVTTGAPSQAISRLSFLSKGFWKPDSRALKSLIAPMLIQSNQIYDLAGLIRDDEQWRKFIIGGKYMGIQYPGIVNTGICEDQVFSCNEPYDLQHLKQVEGNRDRLEKYDYVTIKSVTNYELPEYFAYGNSKIDELLLPNYYSMNKQNNTATGRSSYGNTEPMAATFYGIKRLYKDRTFTDPVITLFPPPEEFKRRDIIPPDTPMAPYSYIDRNVNIKKYLRTLAEASHSTEITNQVVKNGTNILFPYGINDNFGVAEDEMYWLYKHIPYYNSIKLPLRNEYYQKKPIGGPFAPKGEEPSSTKPRLKNILNSIIYGIHNKPTDAGNAPLIFCNMLKKNFIDKDILEGLPVKNFATNSSMTILDQRRVGSPEAEASKKPPPRTINKNVGEANLKYIDLFDALTDEFNLVLPDRTDITQASLVPILQGIRDADFDRLELSADRLFGTIAIRDDDPSYRFYKTIPTLMTIKELMSLLNSRSWSEGIDGFPNVYEARAVRGTQGYWPGDFLHKAGEEKYSEVIGHRIEKKANRTLTENRRSTPVQNIIILRGKKACGYAPGINQTEYEYIDTQIKKGVDYTYNIYEYRAVLGYKYTMDKPIVTRSLGEAPGKSYCLEWYDPSTFESVGSIFETLPSMTEYEGEFDTSAQIFSSVPYLSQINLKIEPVWRIYQIPLISKTVTNTDHLPHALEVQPYQRKDDSQIIGFHLLKENFSPYDFPQGLSEDENKTIQKYLDSQNLIKGEQIVEDGRSMNRYIEIYRTDKKPDSMFDFNGKLVNKKDLIIDKDHVNMAVYTDCFYEEKIKPNTKFYYTFRLVNTEGVKGQFTPIYEAELIDDGNYKYASFNKIEAKTLRPPKMIDQTSKSFKKLLQFVPAANHLIINDKGVNYAKGAESQLSKVRVGINDNPIWDKKFKVRLTSKKTGKKIDINLTYKVKD